MIAGRLRRTEPEPIPCARCGAAFRAGYTGRRCPICDWEAPGEAAPSGAVGRASRLVRDRWPAVLFGLAVAGNVTIAIIVARAVSAH